MNKNSIVIGLLLFGCIADHVYMRYQLYCIDYVDCVHNAGTIRVKYL